MVEAYKNWQQKIEAVSNKNTLLYKQMAQQQEFFIKEKLKYEN